MKVVDFFNKQYLQNGLDPILLEKIQKGMTSNTVNGLTASINVQLSKKNINTTKERCYLDSDMSEQEYWYTFSKFIYGLLI